MTIFVKGIVLLPILLVFQTDPQLEKIEDRNQIDLFNSIHQIERYEAKVFRVNVFFMDNPPGSAGFEGTGEISKDLVLAISEFDEFPRKKLYVLRDIVNPKVVKNNLLYDKIELTIEHRSSGKKETSTLSITFDKVIFNR
ncbi:hypothetical protein [Roseivirga pacifica]|uniref:hypothetical protein n=2 Tax=Roseivirga pacifica TaxID=1267423 RepID=UPI002095E79E|nr:hypothetical protein [Roseivirga pacifica]MCO6359860.1 hypothetical protein [Roseivirga pacifica]MCO6367230.1 hypothetical protein [Roseivirga pacifica]MCO6380145.1 hypothetical protein [Roseivirga pacifica]